MSLQTWKEEFYPIEASQCPREEALAHSLRRWIGWRKENLEKHRVVVFAGRFMANADEPYSGECPISCALCVHFLCEACPIVLHTGDTCSYHVPAREGLPATSPWYAWLRDGDPEPMIELLEKVAAAAKEER